MSSCRATNANLGRVAYDAYRLRRGGVAYDGTAIPEWDALRPEIREAWGGAAAAVIGASSAQTAGAIDLDAARKAARESEHVRQARDQIMCSREVSDETVEALCKESMERAALVLTMAEEIWTLQAEATAERREVNGLVEAHHDAVAQVEAMKGEIAALTAQRDEAQARVKRFETFLPEVGYDPNNV